jgi:pSer/pThr/pTyr-binding forkhead associated (FHA) protein
MSETRLNSVHLEFPRREQFRGARDELLNARGSTTLALENAAPGSNPHTLIQDAKAGIPPGVCCWLMDQQAIYPLKVGVNTVGRLPDNDVVISAPYVSRRHCAILVHAGDGCELHDIASKNGTYINGRKLSGPTRLNSGDEIRMCESRLVFVTKAGPGGDGDAHLTTRFE